ncbi:MAG: hypothetical protein WBD64_12055 [Candidatus Zixiibacteriota bacterium]
MSDIFLGLAILSVLWGVVSSLVIASYLSKRGIDICWIFFKVLIIKYIGQYRRITVQESGKPEAWYYSYVLSMMSALLFAVVGIILR